MTISDLLPAVWRGGLPLIVALAGPCSDGSSPVDPQPGDDADYSVQMDPEISAERGRTVSKPVTIARTGGFDGAIDLSLTGLPVGVSATLDPSTLAGSATKSTLTLKVGPEAVIGATDFTLTARATGVGERSVAGKVKVTGTDTLSVYLDWSEVKLLPGKSVSTEVFALRNVGSRMTVALSVSGLPEGVTATFSLPVLDTTTVSQSTLTLTASTSAPAISQKVVTVIAQPPNAPRASDDFRLTVEGFPGIYTLREVNGKSLPFVMVDDEFEKVEITGGTLTFRPDKTMSYSLTGRSTSYTEGTTEETSFTVTGRYTIEGSAVTVVLDEDDYRLDMKLSDGNRITFSDGSESEGWLSFAFER